MTTPLAPLSTMLQAELDRRIARYDLLTHPFYRAWEEGSLTRADLAAYAAAYYPQVSAFPAYLSRLHARMPDGPRRRALLRNLAGEEIAGRAHSELWLDFAEAMGCSRAQARGAAPLPEMAELVAHFRRLAESGSESEAFAAFYAYEAQVPRLAATKRRGLREHYGVDERGAAYFTLHETADVGHARVWAREVGAMIEQQPAAAPAALEAAETTAAALWRVLDGIETERQRRHQ